ncbi:ABC transporter ATP-binding protein [Streptomyces sp. VNUA24]|uniref:ABC transporter ATP-binding protein n=1 Tax=Streptomyces sp. VNUA24 TaxID=3031131 RepID=UPI0023B870B0|nr:ABC transporter ATP-binding protein [Streptomyces sp. VNUA24]WEH12852.1 ABC transporter ATP-binding protein [Streptomyces sp. VNUA24]
MSTVPVPNASHAGPRPQRPLLQARGLEVHFPVRGRPGRRTTVKAVDGLDLTWHQGEVLGVVGESGSGKSTLGRALLGLERPTAGQVLLDDTALSRARLRDLRRRVQMVFQDPYQALDPRQRVGQIVLEPLEIHRIGQGREDRERLALAALEAVGLQPPERFWGRYPHELSGGQRQRVAIAAAVVLEPEGLICDEPVSALDVSVRNQVLHVLMNLRRDRGLGLVLITHDLGLAWVLCDRVAVMYLGRIVETGPTTEVISDPRHPYTRSLLAAVPRPSREAGERREVLKGEVPDASLLPAGCRFHPRCPRRLERCRHDDPLELTPVGPEGHRTACWLD